MSYTKDYLCLKSMEKDEFYPTMKVFLNDEYGVVMNQFVECERIYNVNETVQQAVTCKLYGLIRWDTNKRLDFEDWRGLWGTFVVQGGYEIPREYQFQFINDDGTLKE